MSNPKVVVLMLTYGRHKHLTEEAIFSFLNQNYENKTLLIINTHPDKIDLSQYKNITVMNVADTFDLPGQKYLFGIQNFPDDTDLWCVLDDDDIILENHISSLVQSYLSEKSINSNLNCVCNDWKFVGNNTTVIAKENTVTWAQFLFEKPEGAFLDKCIASKDCPAYDLEILYSPLLRCSHITTITPTYLYRWGTGSRHLSGWGADGVLELMKLCREEANAISIKDPWEPKWLHDYETQASLL